MIDGLLGTGGTTSSDATQQKEKQQTTKDQFLQLLLAQMKNQDPLNAPDVNQLSEQITQFGQLEQLFNLNDSMEGLTQLTAQSEKSQAINMVGQKVAAKGNKFKMTDTSSGEYGFVLPQSASEVNVEILNSSGKLVRAVNIENQTPGTHFFDFDGLDNNGGTLGEGNYTFRVSAKDGNGDYIQVTPAVKGQVTSVDFSDFGTVLEIDNQSHVTISDVFSIKYE